MPGPTSPRLLKLMATDPLFARLFAAATVPDPIYEAYVRDVEDFLVDFAGAPKRVNIIDQVRLCSSQLLGRRFLVGSLHPLHALTFMRDDARAAPFLPLENGLTAPALVLTPGNTQNHTATEYRSILEHEFVHVCQALLGQYPDGKVCIETPLVGFMAYFHAEFQANYLQLARWPGLWHATRRRESLDTWTLEDWCILRGYQQPLETILHLALDGHIQLSVMADFLERLPALLVAELHQARLHAGMANWLVANFAEHVGIALGQVMQLGVRPKPKAAKMLRSWLSSHGQ